MGLRNLLSRWRKGENARVIERAEEGRFESPTERAMDDQDYEARKDDLNVLDSYGGIDARRAAEGELES